MRHILTATLAAAIALAPLGCGNKSPEGGQPGTKDTFKIVAPSSTGSSVSAPVIKRDTIQTIELSLKAESGFTGQKIALKAEAPAGLRVEVKPASVDLAAGKEVKVQLEVRAEKDAAVGEATVKVTATPEKGTATSDSVKVKVEEANPSAAKDTFSLSLPTVAGLTGKSVKREATETVELTLKGDAALPTQKISLKVEGPDKVKAELRPASVELTAGQEAKVQLVITPAKDAAPGDYTVRVTATPAAGVPMVKEMKLKVE